MTDTELLERYTSENSEASFQALVNRYLPLVYSAALRQVRNSAMAQDVAQVVFIILARKAAHLSSGTVIPAWLFRTTRHVGMRALRTEIRRQKREQEALHMQTSESTDIWEQLAPHLDEAMNSLGEVERGAVILHYFENRRLREVGAALGMTEDTAQKRVSRAVEKLRKILFQRGVVLPAVALPGLLMTRAVSAAPAQLGTSITAAALNKSAISASVYGLLEQTLTHTITPALKAGIATAATVAIIGGGIVAFWPNHPKPGPRLGPSPHELEARTVAEKFARAAAAVQSSKPGLSPIPPPRARADANAVVTIPAPVVIQPVLTPSRPPVVATNSAPRTVASTQELATAKTDNVGEAALNPVVNGYPGQFPGTPNSGNAAPQSSPGAHSAAAGTENQNRGGVSPLLVQPRASTPPRSNVLKKKNQ